MSTVQEALKVERQNISFNVDVLGQFLYGNNRYNLIKKQYPKWVKVPTDYNTFNNGRVALIKEAYSVMPIVYNNFNLYNDDQALYALLSSNHQMPGSVNVLMFIRCIQLMGTQQQIQRYLKKSVNYQIVGCYAQTQLGHGSDVRNLQTTATYDQKTQQFIINSPSVSSAKFWPGQLGLIANYALVYAQLIIKDKKYGVQAFFVPIRDQNQNTLPGIQAGDIGAKLGYHAKQNGYMILSNVRIPRTQMLGKFNEVTADGKFISKGDPRIAYATMMKIRVFISVICPRMYGIIITIATRYSMFRTQFKGKSGQQKIIDYQTQKDKIISRVAQSYAILSAGHKIQQMASKNQQILKTKGDSSLMQQTHIVLSFSKALYSQIALQGMQICRKACGGHGFSHYAGFNVFLGQYYTNPTHQGQNTILYLQVAKYIMKNYQYFMTKSKPLGQSVKYIESIQFYQNYKCKINSQDSNSWQSNDIRIILTQGCTYLIAQIAEIMMTKQQNQTDADIFNYKKGSRLQKLAILHGYVYTYQCFIQRIMSFRHQKGKQILNDLCLLFGANVLLGTNISSILIEGGFINQIQIRSLNNLKQKILSKLRQQLIGLVDAYGFPQHLIRSQIAKGNPYQNFLNMVRKNPLNQKIPQSAFVVKNIKNYLKNAKL